jgi:hypothetical protein
MKKSEKGKKIHFYECRNCGTQIPPNTGGIFTSCKCGKMSIDGTDFYTRILGNLEEIEQVTDLRKTHVYRIRQVKTGLFFVPRRGYISAHFSSVGKFYGRKPSLSWVSSDHGKCVVEEYVINRI